MSFIKIIFKLNFVRLWNLVLLYVSFILSLVLKKSVIWGQPYGISVEPTTNCNLQCSQCPSGLKLFTRPTGMLDFELFKKIINQICKKTFFLILYFQGEPYMNKDFFKFVKYAKSKNMFVSTSTNAHFLDKNNAKKTVISKLDYIIISIDGADQKIYEQYRKNGHLETVINNTKQLLKCKKDLNSSFPYIEIQFIVFRHNEHQINDIQKIAKEIGVNKLSIKTAQIYNYQNSKDIVPVNEKYSRYKKDKNGKYRLKKNLKNRCFKSWTSCVITWDGKVAPCCFDKDLNHDMGNVKSQKLEQIWKSEKYKAFKNQIFNNRSKIDICKNCNI